MPAGNATPPHVHAREDESIHLLAGELECDVAGRSIRLRPGETVLLPRQTRHQLRNAGTQAARALVLCTPAGFESFVAAAGQRASAPSAAGAAPPPPDQLVTLAAAFGITILA